MSSPSNIEQWLDSLPEEVIQREMDEWEARLHEANVEFSKRREILDLKRRWRETYRRSPQPDTAPSPIEGEGSLFPERPSSIRESVLRVFAAAPAKETWTTPEIAALLIERGWMESNEKSIRSLQSALSRMRSEGDVVRVRHGVYRSAAQATAAQAFAERGGEPD
jgi:hypothetical protein